MTPEQIEILVEYVEKEVSPHTVKGLRWYLENEKTLDLENIMAEVKQWKTAEAQNKIATIKADLEANGLTALEITDILK